MRYRGERRTLPKQDLSRPNVEPKVPSSSQAQHLSGEIKRLLPGLRVVGIEIEFTKNSDRTARLITITKTPRK